MINDVLTAYAALLADLEVTVQDPTSVDDALAQPYEWQPNTLYLYPGPVSEVPFETGPTVRQDFSFSAVFMADSHEEADKRRSRATSDLLERVRELLMTTARQHQSTVTWDHMRAAESPAPPRTLQGRAVAVTLSGWRIRY